MIPPGVYVNQDKSEVTAPQTLSEWYIHYYKQVKSICKESQNMVAHKRPVVGVCRAGEVIFVPSGWWHCVMNISESIAITQNFVDDYNLANVLKFIRDKKDQVSGVDKPEELYDSFGKLLKHRMPEVIDRMMAREVENGREFSWEKKAKNSGIWDSVNGTKVDSGFQFKF